jgi:hypothetical protein
MLTALPIQLPLDRRNELRSVAILVHEQAENVHALFD